MVERFHQQLKAALKCHSSPNWMDTLPLVLLGVRTALKEDLNCTAAELVYGTTLRLPGEFFNTTVTHSNLEPDTYVTQLKTAMQQIQAPTVRDNQQHRAFHGKALDSCTHVFVRHDATLKPLQAPYDGPFRVITKRDKHFTVELNGRNDTVSVDRLKPAFIDSSTTVITPQSHTPTPPANPVTVPSSTSQPPIRTTRSGRHIHWPDRLNL